MIVYLIIFAILYIVFGSLVASVLEDLASNTGNEVSIPVLLWPIALIVFIVGYVYGKFISGERK